MKYQFAIFFTVALTQTNALALNPKVFTELVKAADEASELRAAARLAKTPVERAKLHGLATEKDIERFLNTEFLQADPQLKIHQLAKETSLLQQKVRKGEGLTTNEYSALPGHHRLEWIGGRTPPEVRQMVQENKQKMKQHASTSFQCADAQEIEAIKHKVLSGSTGERALLYLKLQNRLNPAKSPDRTLPIMDKLEIARAAGHRSSRTRKLNEALETELKQLIDKHLGRGTGMSVLTDLDKVHLEEGKTIKSDLGSADYPSRMDIYTRLAGKLAAKRVSEKDIISVINQLEDKLTAPGSATERGRSLEQDLMLEARSH